jgi:hypothetical protein
MEILLWAVGTVGGFKLTCIHSENCFSNLENPNATGHNAVLWQQLVLAQNFMLYVCLPQPEFKKAHEMHLYTDANQPEENKSAEDYFQKNSISIAAVVQFVELLMKPISSIIQI